MNPSIFVDYISHTEDYSLQKLGIGYFENNFSIS
jgi:hypothetical protein